MTFNEVVNTPKQIWDNRNKSGGKKKVKRTCVNGVTTLMENLEVNKLKIFRGDKVMSFISFLL